jgi:hypothetical protein
MTAPPIEVACRVELTAEERTELLRLLEHSLVEAHAERHRTEAPDYRAAMARQEEMLRCLADRLRAARP